MNKEYRQGRKETFRIFMESTYRQSPHLLIRVERVGVGLFPLVLALICRDDLAMYGIRYDGLLVPHGAAHAIYALWATGPAKL